MSPTENLPRPSISIIDKMNQIQRINGVNKTFIKFAECIQLSAQNESAKIL